MHYHKHSKDLTENEIIYQNFMNHNHNLPKARSKIESNRLPTLNQQTKQEETIAVRGENEASDTEKFFTVTTTSSSTDSTDSGVNLSDNDDIPPPAPKYSQSLTFETNSTESHCYKTFRKHNTNINRDNNEGNNCKNVINGNKNNIINYFNNVDHDDDENEHINSQNFDNKSSTSALNVCQQGNLEILTPRKTSATTPSEEHNDKPSFQHNEFIHLQRRFFPTTSSLSSMSSTTNSYDDNLPTNMHHCKGSPVVSIRSINSAIITSDSDSDLSSDAENYVIKKLGTQVTYSPNHAAIPHINSGQTVVNQKVIANSNQAPLPPLEALAVIGDRIGAAQALGPVPSISGVAQRPHIGSIALSNSSDVTFGDKHFYEGPVTIQQFLIDSTDKWKETNGKDNPVFPNGNVESSTDNAKDTSSETQKSSTVYEYIWKRRRIVIPGILALSTLLIVAAIWGSLGESKNTNTSYNFDVCEGNGTLCFIDRDVWRAHPQTGPLEKQKLPLHRVVISHTASEPCDSLNTCAGRVRVIQEFHMNSLGWDDIAYNFLISSDGFVYVGRGWDYVGAHTKGYNYDSVGITFIGTYISVEPTEVQLNACLSLLEEGMRLNKLTPDYRLYGARQLGATESPGEMLYNRIKKWEHWSANINLK